MYQSLAEVFLCDDGGSFRVWIAIIFDFDGKSIVRLLVAKVNERLEYAREKKWATGTMKKRN